jgi:vitamin B12 transporter
MRVSDSPKRFFLLALICCSGAGVPGHAQQQPVSVVEEVVVTASRVAQPQSQSVRPTTVITAEDIGASGQQTLVELLQSLGGVEITSNGGAGQTTAVFIRGANSNQTLVLVDGMRVNSATAGTTAFENIPVNQIERVEIVAGPSSGLYGSEAIGGVIQIFTKSGKYSPGANIAAGAGKYNTRTMSGGFRHSVKDTDFSLNVGTIESDGFNATKSTIGSQYNPDRDGYRNTNISGKVAQHLGDNHEVGMTLFQSEGNTHFDNGLKTDDVNHQTLSTYSVYSRNHFTKDWQSLVRLGQGQDNSAISGSFPSSTRTTQQQATWQNDVKLGPGTILLGGDYLAQNVKASTVYTQTYRTVKSVFGGYLGQYGNHGWQANARQDNNSQFGNYTTGNLAYAYSVTAAFKLRAGTGTGFKAPTFNDLYFPGFSNPNLQPERSRSQEAGADYQIGGHRFRATFFTSDITNLIVSDKNFIPQNVNKARIKGTELDYLGHWGDYTGRAQVTLQDPVDEVTGFLLRRRAREHATFSLSRSMGAWRAGAELVATGVRFDSINESPASRLHGYGLVNLTGSYAVNKEWSIRARWNNIANRDYALVQNYNTPGSNVFVSVNYQPK